MLGLVLGASAAAAGDDRGDVPASIYDAINARITAQTTFLQLGKDNPIRWSPRSIELITFVKAPSQTYADTYLYAMIFKVSVASDISAIDLHGTTCQVVVVLKYGAWDDPTVVCEPVYISPPDRPS